jgi:5-methyltetrahydropteroyltriglutamate--homocysteine methyltransferase
VGEIRVKDIGPVREDIENFQAALDGAAVAEGFMNAASPGVIALFQPNHHYPDHESYLEAIAEAMSSEYEAITQSGLILQLDSPDLGLGRHMMFKDKSDAEYQRLAGLHVEALNHATRNIAPDRMRLHVCWGNYEGPHHRDAPMSMVLPIALRARPQALLFEASNPRHAHEWAVFRDSDIPEDKILVPGVLDSTTNFIEHPELVAERICRFTDIVGCERVGPGHRLCQAGLHVGGGPDCKPEAVALTHGRVLPDQRGLLHIHRDGGPVPDAGSLVHGRGCRSVIHRDQ